MRMIIIQITTRGMGMTSKGDELEAGVYFYTITASENIDPIEGTVTIFRK